jgi:hypothetical protein
MIGTAVVSASGIVLGAVGILPLGLAIWLGAFMPPVCLWFLGRFAFDLWRKSKDKRARNVHRKPPQQ